MSTVRMRSEMLNALVRTLNPYKSYIYGRAYKWVGRREFYNCLLICRLRCSLESPVQTLVRYLVCGATCRSCRLVGLRGCTPNGIEQKRNCARQVLTTRARPEY
jgi:hypothetical protein